MATIVAISTAPGIGGIGIIRMSGKESFEILDKIFKTKSGKSIVPVANTIKYGYIVSPQTNEVIDEVLVSYFMEPKSYTTENMCEINSHGSTIAMKQILDLCIENGAKLAEPGEFTKRAFLNGRMDLSQAEAVIDILNAKTEKESKASMHQLEGYLSNDLKKIKEKLLEIMATIEVGIDYPEYEIEEVMNLDLENRLKQILKEFQILEKSFDKGKILRDGIKVAIIGRPNAGKSSLLNCMLREERAIVTEIEGTTRDTIEEYINIEGVPFKIIDTAGIRKAKDEVEKIGIEKAKEMAEEADLIIAILDSSRPIEAEDKEILEMIKGKKAIIVLNKVDILKKEKPSVPDKEHKIIAISAKEKIGIEELYQEMINLFSLNQIQVQDEALITNVRHKNAITEARKAIEKALETIQKGLPIDLIAIPVKEALEAIGEITGENASEAIVEEIFARFCLGK